MATNKTTKQIILKFKLRSNLAIKDPIEHVNIKSNVIKKRINEFFLKNNHRNDIRDNTFSFILFCFSLVISFFKLLFFLIFYSFNYKINNQYSYNAKICQNKKISHIFLVKFNSRSVKQYFRSSLSNH